jgi:hypothetical protein
MNQAFGSCRKTVRNDKMASGDFGKEAGMFTVAKWIPVKGNVNSHFSVSNTVLEYELIISHMNPSTYTASGSNI